MIRINKLLYTTLITFLFCYVAACNNSGNQGREDAAGTDTVPSKADTARQPTITAGTVPIPPDKLIIPGKTIGHISLGDDAATLETKLGKADFSDAAMGKAWTTWYGKGQSPGSQQTELNVYTTYKDSTMSVKTVQQIRTTSSFFLTADSVGVTASLEKVRSAFPGLKKVGSYREEKSSMPMSVYDDKAKGIAFEVDETVKPGVCKGIILHTPGVNVLDTYIMLHPDMNRE